MKRWSFLIVAVLVVTGIAAQPGWLALSVVFSLYDKGVAVQPRDLQVDPTFHFWMDGRETTPNQVAGTDRSVLRFDARRSDPMMQTDTLWMEIVRGQERMRIAFPPPYRDADAKPFSATNLHIDFVPGVLLAYELPLDVRLLGTAENVVRWYPFGPWEGLYLKSGDRFWHSGDLRGNTGRIDAEVACVPYFLGGRQWVDLTLEVAPGEYDPIAPRRMTIRTPVQEIVDVKDFDFVNTRVLWNGTGLVLDRAVACDSAIMGNTRNTAAIVHPVNASVGDTLAIELRWMGAGAPHVSGHRFATRDDGATEIRFRFALRTDVDVDDMSGPERATPFVFTDLPTGRYVITQEAASLEYAADLDVLIGKEIPVVVGPRAGCQE